MISSNYFGSFLKEFERKPKSFLRPESLYNNYIKETVEFGRIAQKFKLPKGGKFFETDLRALLDVPINLPYPLCLFEFENESEPDGRPIAHIIIAEQYTDRSIEIRLIFGSILAKPDWIILPDTLRIIPKTNCEEISTKNYMESVIARFNAELKSVISRTFDLQNPDDLILALINSLTVVFSVIEALSCSNVSVEKLERPKVKKGTKLTESKNNYTYHSLVIDSGKTDTSGNDSLSEVDRHKPREHLRRGHIRRQNYKNNVVKNIWINSVVVNAGKGGKVEKDYVII